PYLFKDLFMMFLYVFAMAASSFSVPIIVGGRATSTLETLIYEKVMVESQLGQAVVLCFIQFAMLFALSELSRQKVYPMQTGRNLELMKARWGYVPLLLISVAIVFVNIQGFSKGITEIQKLSSVYSIFVKALLGTIS